MNTRKLALLIGCIFLGLHALIWLVRQQLIGHKHAQLRRFSMILTLEFMTGLGNWLICYRLMASFRYLVKDCNSMFLDIVRTCLLIFVVAVHCCLIFYYVSVSHEPYWLAVFCFVSLGVFIHLCAFLVFFTLVEFFISFVPSSQSQTLGCRRIVQIVFCSSIFHTILSLFLSFALTVLGLYSSTSNPFVKNQSIRLNNMATEFDGFKIALLTDIHVGPTVGRTRIEQIVSVVNQLNPDLIAIAGDLTDGSVSDLKYALQPFEQLMSKHGVFYATGNHEYYHGDVNEWFGYLTTLGVRPLHNSNKRIFKSSSRYLCVAGVDDISAESSKVTGHKMDLPAALTGCDRNETIILLAHQPAAAKRLLASPDGPNIDLILSGHTHGGQMYPVAPLSYLSNPFYLGLYHHSSGAQVYVSAGVNFWGPPVKMYGLNEVTLIELKNN